MGKRKLAMAACLIFIPMSMTLMGVGSALANSAAVVKAHSAAFAKAFNACNVPAELSLYEDNAVVIWPGKGDVAIGRAAIEKLMKAQCSTSARQTLKEISSDSHAIAKNYIVNVGMWKDTMPGPDGKPIIARIRTTEVIHKSRGKWRYMVDHASIGVPHPHPPTKP